MFYIFDFSHCLYISTKKNRASNQTRPILYIVTNCYYALLAPEELETAQDQIIKPNAILLTKSAKL